MMQAALPPSSRVTFFLPDCCFSFQPTSGDPVKLTICMRSSDVKEAAERRSQGKMENEPRGRLHSASTSPIKERPSGVFVAGLRMKGHPSQSPERFCALRGSGKLNGVIKEASRRELVGRYHDNLLPARKSLGSSSPFRRTDSSAAISKVSISLVTSPLASRIGLPASMQSEFASSSNLSCRIVHAIIQNLFAAEWRRISSLLLLRLPQRQCLINSTLVRNGNRGHHLLSVFIRDG